MKTKYLLSLTALAMSGLASTGHAALGDLNNPLITYVSYGDGRSYSLPIAELTCNANPGGTFNGVDCTTYRVPSTPGHIQDLVVIATGAEGKQVTTNFSGMDNAYSTPSGVSGSIYFTPQSNTDGLGTSRGFTGTVQNNDPTTWDTSLAALRTFLNNGLDDPIFFFNNNQVNSGDSTNQHLAAWARLWITDAAGNIVQFANGAESLLFANRTPITGPNSCLGGGGAPSAYAIVPNGGGCPNLVDPNNTVNFVDPGSPGDDPFSGQNAGPLSVPPGTGTDYVLSGGRVCLDANFFPLTCGSPGVVYNNIDHNLGADTVAYAIIFPELNTALDTLFGSLTPGQLADYTFHLDVRFGCDKTKQEKDKKGNLVTVEDPANPECVGRSLNNGYEQLFLGSTSSVPTGTPEPGTLALLGGILGIWAVSRRVRRQAR